MPASWYSRMRSTQASGVPEMSPVPGIDLNLARSSSSVAREPVGASNVVTESCSVAGSRPIASH